MPAGAATIPGTQVIARSARGRTFSTQLRSDRISHLGTSRAAIAIWRQRSRPALAT